MKRILAAVLLLVCLAGCGQRDPGTSDTAGAEAPVTGARYDTGTFSVLVPEGWLAVSHTDEDGEPDKNNLTLVRGAEEPGEMAEKVFVSLYFCGPRDDYVSSRDLYRRVEEMEPVTIGQITWGVFTASRNQCPYTVLTGQVGSCVFQAAVRMEAEDGSTLSLEDAEVVAIVESLRAD